MHKVESMMVCKNKCDSIVYLTWFKWQRILEAQESWQKKKLIFKFRSLNDMKSLLLEREDDITESEDSETPEPNICEANIPVATYQLGGDEG